MRKNMKSLFAILMTFVVVITAIPMMEAKAEETYSNVTFVFQNQTGSELYTVVKESVSSEITIREILGDDCTPTDSELGTFLGWNYEKTLITVDAKISVSCDDSVLYFSPVFEKNRLYLLAEYLDKDGEMKYLSEQFIVDYGTTYNDLLERLPSESQLYTGFVEWKLRNEANLEDTIIDSNFRVFARYTNYPITLTQVYIATDGSVKTVETKKEYPAGTTGQEILNGLEDPTDISSTDDISSWLLARGPSLENSIEDFYTEIEFVAQYEDKQIIAYSYSYVEPNGEYGLPKYEDSYFVVNNSVAQVQDTLQQYIEENYLNKITHFDELGFNSWDTSIWDYNSDNYYEYISCEPIYTKSQLHLWYNEDEVHVYAIEPGQTVQLPTVVNGKYVTWLSLDDGKEYNETYIVPDDLVAGMRIPMEMIVGEDVPVTPPVENPPAENPPAENPPAENPPAENPPAENPPAENPPAENPPAENPPAENPPAENPSAQTPSVDNSSAEDNETTNNPVASPKTGDANMVTYVCLLGIVGCLMLTYANRKNVK